MRGRVHELLLARDRRAAGTYRVTSDRDASHVVQCLGMLGFGQAKLVSANTRSGRNSARDWRTTRVVVPSTRRERGRVEKQGVKFAEFLALVLTDVITEAQ
jgi:hypothetical protein